MKEKPAGPAGETHAQIQNEQIRSVAREMREQCLMEASRISARYPAGIPVAVFESTIGQQSQRWEARLAEIMRLTALH